MGAVFREISPLFALKLKGYNMTRAIIYANLLDTPYTFSISPVNSEKYTFHFSSRSYLDKFEKLVRTEHEKINLYLMGKYNVRIDSGCLAYFTIYNRIETRGFLIRVNNTYCRTPADLPPLKIQ